LANDLLEQRYLGFCQEVGVKPSAAGTFGVKRRFWITVDAEAFLLSQQTSETQSTLGDVVEEQVPEEYSGRLEGQTIMVQALRRARSIINRQRAIECHGVICAVCGFNFEAVYGELGRGFIEIHHLKPLGETDEELLVNPKTDLIPLCANCHRMIHRSLYGLFTPDELKGIMSSNRIRLVESVKM
jgi:5-methylcytosine-specific restriction protein A